MDNESVYQGLYKSNCGILKNIQNRTTQAKTLRQEKRNDRFQSYRIISPTPKKKIITEKKSSPKVRVQSKQKAFCQKFMAWKQEKYKKKNEEPKCRKKPFISTCTAGGFGSVPKKETSFAPKKYVFVPPQSLKLMDGKKKMAHLVVNKVKNNKTDQLTQNCLLPPKKSPIFVKKKQASVSIKTVANQPKPKISTCKLSAPKEKLLKENLKPQKCSVPVPGKLVKPISNFGNQANSQNAFVQGPALKTKLLKEKFKIQRFTFPKPEKLIKPISNTRKDVKIKANIKSTENKNDQLQSHFNAATKIKSETSNENANNSLKSFYTSTQKKLPLNLNEALKIEPLISPIEIEPQLVVDVKIKHNNLSVPSPIIKPKNVVLNSNKPPKFSINLKAAQNNLCVPSPSTKQRNNLNLTETTIKNSEKPSKYSCSSARISVEKIKSFLNVEEDLKKSAPKELYRVKDAASDFRKNLDNETERLHNLCRSWETYKNDNHKLLTDNEGADMINVTIGQTKLLTSKKFQQFRGLIDRFKNSEYQNVNDEKPIRLEDLEGFWCMISLQIDNVEKRIEQLNRWKNNNWCDPDENYIQTKPNRLLTKVTKKPKAIKKNRGIQDYLKKLHADVMKNKEIDLIPYEETPKKLLSERKSISMRQTIPLRRSSRCLILSANKNSKKSPRISNIDHVRNITPHKQLEWQCENLLKFNEKLTENEILKTPIMLPRKSILKTPGTLKRNQNVVFNENLYLKSPEEISSSKQKRSANKNSSGRSTNKRLYSNERLLKLRSRNVIVDQSAHIEIP